MERIKKLFLSTTPVKWLFCGDSITQGAGHTFGHRDFTELFEERVRSELGRYLDVVINTGISGYTTRDLLSGYDWRIAQFKPHVVFIMIGMNDCSTGRDIDLAEFGINLNLLADKIENLGGQLVLQTTCPILPGIIPDREPYIDSYMDTIRQVAAGRHLPLVDHTTFWKEHKDQHWSWMLGAFHPNQYGHRALAHHLFRSLGIYDEKSQTCRLFFP